MENAKGDVLWAPESLQAPVLSPEEAWIMVDMMKDVIRRGTAAGSVGEYFHYPAGGKTGTTNDGNDVWFVGYTSDLVAGVWMGFDKPQKIKANAQGGILAAPAWTAFMSEVYRRKPAPRDWPRPEDIVTKTIDGSTGLLATPYCPRNLVYTEVYIPGTEPTRPCDVHTGPADSLLTDTTGRVTSPFALPRDSASRPRRDTSRVRPPADTSSLFALPQSKPRVKKP